MRTLIQHGKNLHPALARVLALRDIATPEVARSYFRGTLHDLEDPLHMHGMAGAVDRLVDTIRQNERILLYGDYDVDGTSSVALLTEFFNAYGVETRFFIPDRFTDGYGLCERGIDYAQSEGASLIITVDCGISSVAEVAYAKGLGLDLIICDHHEPGEALPDAVAVVDPKNPDCPYRFKELSACGIAYGLAIALANDPRTPAYPGRLEDLLEFVALSTVADVMPLQGENRVLVREGLRRLRQSRRLGIRALANSARIELDKLTAMDIGWRLGPRINAAGRMGDASDSVELLLAKTPAAAQFYADKLEQANRKRQAEGVELQKAIRKMAPTQLAGQHGFALVLSGEDWHRGILGNTASKVADEFSRPTFLLSIQNGEATGSGRTFGSINVYEALHECQDLLTKFGGHKAAGGLTLPADNIRAFRERVSRYVKRHMRPEDFEPKTYYDAALPIGDVTDQFFKALSYCEPFGTGNEEPVFMAKGVRVTDARAMGRESAHLVFKAADTGEARKVIAWGKGDQAGAIRSAGRLDLLYTIEENHWRGSTTLELRAPEFRPSQ